MKSSFQSAFMCSLNKAKVSLISLLLSFLNCIVYNSRLKEKRWLCVHYICKQWCWYIIKQQPALRSELRVIVWPDEVQSHSLNRGMVDTLELYRRLFQISLSVATQTKLPKWVLFSQVIWEPLYIIATRKLTIPSWSRKTDINDFILAGFLLITRGFLLLSNIILLNWDGSVPPSICGCESGSPIIL